MPLGLLAQPAAQRIDAGAGLCAQGKAGNRTMAIEAQTGLVAALVDLVEDHQLGHVGRTDFGNHVIDGFDLAVAVGRAGIDHVQQHIGLGRFFQRGLEGLHQPVRQVADEAHRVGQDDVGPRPQMQPPGERIERGKELVGRQRPRTGEAIEQRGLAGVGVADQRHAQGLAALAGTTARAALAIHLLQPFAHLADLVVDHPAVQLQLGFAGAAAHTDTAALALEVGPHPHQARGLVLQPGKLDLQLALVAAGTLGKYFDDQFGAVGHLHLPETLQVALLDGADGVIEQHQADTRGAQLVGNAFGRSGPQIQAGIGAAAAQHLAHDGLETGRAGQRLEFVEIVCFKTFALRGHGQQGGAFGIGGVRIPVIGNVLVFQWEPPSAGNSMARLGTTVEMACL